jgi:16S rRNA (guanine527-N7)-methyltransferase
MYYQKNDRVRDDRDRALALVPVSRETAERFDVYVGLLDRWLKKNLFADATRVWTRHISDCAQVLLMCPRCTRWLDIGSGAGFPGMVLAIQLADIPGAEVHCVDADPRRCAFLREVARATCSPAFVYAATVQSLRSEFGSVDGVTARAIAPLSETFDMAEGWLKAGAVGVFPRGQSVAMQLEVLGAQPNYDIEIVPSIIDSRAAALRVRWDATSGRQSSVRIPVL